MVNTVLQAEGLCKQYGKTQALSDFSVALEPNKIYGLLGRNGAGKTTFLNIITSRIFADAGSVAAFGEDAVENQQILPRICYMAEKNLFVEKMTVRELLRFAALFYPRFDRAYAAALCKRFDLNIKNRYRALSRGYESILRIVIGLASRAELTIFDEPTLGLDAAARDQFYQEIIGDFSEHPRTFLLSTHLIEESAGIFEEVIMVKQGRLMEQTQVDALRQRACYLTGRADAVEKAAQGLRTLHTEDIAGLRICAVYGDISEEQKIRWRQDGLEVSPVPVQKLFIYLTDAHKEEN
ncbi:ABC transporter ATP-binding protein [Ethanoligenens sp.]|uniref:ABC transporter ATP-binding protein n=1 Tax=Ethanoligenens sp. TaxID=2099655 RepID=UPI0039E851EF